MIGAAHIDTAQMQHLQAYLNALPNRVRENAVRAAMRKTVNILKSEAKSTVPVKTGALQKSLTTKIASGNRIIGSVGVFQGKEIKVYASAKDSKKFSTRKARTVTRTQTKKPWMYAVKVEDKRGFLVKASNNKRGEVIAAFEQNIRAEVEKRGAIR